MYVKINKVVVGLLKFQLTIEHDPDAISQRVQSFPPSQMTNAPLTTTHSDTSIPTENFTKTKSNGLAANIEKNHTNSSDNLRGNSLLEPTADDEGKNNKHYGPLHIPGDKERLFKRKDEGYMSGTRSRQLLRRKNNLEKRPSLDKERSSSMSRLLDE